METLMMCADDYCGSVRTFFGKYMKFIELTPAWFE
jgi:hypothetical protein